MNTLTDVENKGNLPVHVWEVSQQEVVRVRQEPKIFEAPFELSVVAKTTSAPRAVDGPPFLLHVHHVPRVSRLAVSREGATGVVAKALIQAGHHPAGHLHTTADVNIRGLCRAVLYYCLMSVD